MKKLLIALLLSLASANAADFTIPGSVELQSLSQRGASVGFVNPYSVPNLYLSLIGDTLTNTYSLGQSFTNWPGTGPTVSSSTSTSGPSVTQGVSGHYGAFFDLTNDLRFTASWLMNSNITCFFAFEQTNMTAKAGRYMLSGQDTHLFIDNNTTVTTWDVWYYDAALQNLTNSGYSYAPPILNYPSLFNPIVLSFRWQYNDTNWPCVSSLGINKAINNSYSQYPTNFFVSGSSGLVYIGNAKWGQTVNNGIRGKLMEVLIYTNTLTQDYVSQISDYLCNKYQARTLPFIWLEGDGGPVGGGMDNSAKTVAPMYRQVTNNLNTADGGGNASTLRTAQDILTAATNGSMANLYFSGRPDNIYWIYWGSSAYIVTNTATNMWYYMGSSYAAAKAIGYKVMATTLLPSGSTNDAERLAYNNLVRSNWFTVADDLIDFTALPNTAPGDSTNGVYYLQSSGFVYPSVWNSIQCADLVLRHIRKLATTNLISKP